MDLLGVTHSIPKSTTSKLGRTKGHGVSGAMKMVLSTQCHFVFNTYLLPHHSVVLLFSVAYPIVFST